MVVRLVCPYRLEVGVIMRLDPMVAAVVGHRGDVVDQLFLVKYKSRILQVTEGIPP